MKDNPKLEAKPIKRSRLTAAESLSEPAIRRQLLVDALQHPAVLLPLAVFIMSVFYLALVSPILGGGLSALVLLAICGLLAVVSFVWRYVLCYTKEYGKRAQELMDVLEAERVRLELEEIGQRHEALRAGYTSIGSTQGLNAFTALAGEYEQLQPALVLRRDTDPLSVSLVLPLATETYRQGLSVLSDALELMRAVDNPGRERLERETSELEREIEALKGDESQAERRVLKEDTLASHRQRLDMLDQLRLHIDQLLYQAGRCEASLHRTRLELAAIRTGSSETSVGSVIEALRGTIHQAKEVQDELRRLGY
jgi:hypothetical protein